MARLLGITQTHWDALWLAVVLCAALRLLPLILFWPWRRTLEAMAQGGPAQRSAPEHAEVAPCSPAAEARA